MAASILAPRDRLSLDNGFDLRLLSAMEVLQARREGEELSEREGERALCVSACLLARALEHTDSEAPVFSGGREVLAGLTVEEITALADRWSAFSRESAPRLEGAAEDRAEVPESRPGPGDAARDVRFEEGASEDSPADRRLVSGQEPDGTESRQPPAGEPAERLREEDRASKPLSPRESAEEPPAGPEREGREPVLSASEENEPKGEEQGGGYPLPSRRTQPAGELDSPPAQPAEGPGEVWRRARESDGLDWAERADRAFRRDSRRYDGGFYLF